MNEKNLQSQILLKVGSRSDTRLFRNNQGVATYPDGSQVRYGICNPGGSDLIGYHSRIITPDMVGTKVAIFTAIEVKSQDGRIKPEQQKFIDTINDAGGIATVARSVEQAESALNVMGVIYA